MPNEAVVENLRKARSLFYRKRWLKGSYSKPIGHTKEVVAVCILGAVYNTCEYGQDSLMCNLYLARAIKDRTGLDSSIAWFNDKIAKNKKEALELFDDAIKLAKRS